MMAGKGDTDNSGRGGHEFPSLNKEGWRAAPGWLFPSLAKEGWRAAPGWLDRADLTPLPFED